MVEGCHAIYVRRFRLSDHARADVARRVFALDVVLAELVDGQPLFLSSPAVRHQHLLFQIALALEARRPSSLMILPAPMDWVLWQVPRATVRQPDLLVVPADTVTTSGSPPRRGSSSRSRSTVDGCSPRTSSDPAVP